MDTKYDGFRLGDIVSRLYLEQEDLCDRSDGCWCSWWIRAVLTASTYFKLSHTITPAAEIPLWAKKPYMEHPLTCFAGSR